MKSVLRKALLWAPCSVLPQLIGLVLPWVADSFCASHVTNILHEIILQLCWAKMQCSVAASSNRFGGEAGKWLNKIGCSNPCLRWKQYSPWYILKRCESFQVLEQNHSIAFSFTFSYKCLGDSSGTFGYRGCYHVIPYCEPHFKLYYGCVHFLSAVREELV